MRRLLAIVFSIGAFALGGCSAYHLGTGSEVAFQSLYVAPVENSAGIPQGTGLYSVELRQAFLKDGRIRLVNTPAEADATLLVDLHRFERIATSARPDDTRLARKFDLEVVALCTLHDNRSNRDYFAQRQVTAARQIYTTATSGIEISAQQQAEYNTHPLIAQTLAQSILHTTVDTW